MKSIRDTNHVPLSVAVWYLWQAGKGMGFEE